MAIILTVKNIHKNNYIKQINTVQPKSTYKQLQMILKHLKVKCKLT